MDNHVCKDYRGYRKGPCGKPAVWRLTDNGYIHFVCGVHLRKRERVKAHWGEGIDAINLKTGKAFTGEEWRDR